MFPRFLEFASELMRNQWRTRDEILRIQERKFLAMVRYAYATVPFYNRKYRSAKLTPGDIASIKDIRKLPFITKDEAKTVPLEERMSRAIRIEECTVARTSGSTGEPLKVAIDGVSSDYIRAYHFRRFVALGFKPWNKMIFLGSARRSIVTGNIVSSPAGGMFLGAMGHLLDHRARNLSIDLSLRQQLGFLSAFQPTFILGPPSYFKILAKAVSDERWPIAPKKVLSWGEILDTTARTAIKSGLGAEVFDGYGCTEVAPIGGLAWECTSHTGMHINADCVALEFLKDGEPVSPNEGGEVVATSLYRLGTPMIRYKLGDVGVPSDESCPCGRGFPLMKGLEGRTADFLFTPDGRIISPYAIFQLMEHIRGVLRFKVRQDAGDHIAVLVEKGTDFSDEDSRALGQAFANLFGPTVTIDFTFVDRIEREKGKKFQAVTRDLPLDMSLLMGS